MLLVFGAQLVFHEQTASHLLQIIGQGRLDSYAFAGSRLIEGQHRRVQTQSMGGALSPGMGIERVAQHGVMALCQMNADLVGSTGL